SRAIAQEVKEGRGSKHGGAYFSLRHIPRNLLEEVFEENKDNLFLVKLKKAGIDLRFDAIEVGPGAHYVQGGCWINEKCETDLPGLYAIGEAGSGGKDGADRLGGTAIPFCMAMGMIAGKEAALRAQEKPVPEMDGEQVEKSVERALAPMKREQGIRPFEIRQKIRNIMSAHAVFARTEDGLSMAFGEMEKFHNIVVSQLWVSNKARRFNLDWAEALEAANMVTNCEMVLRSALMRKESRGLHDRADYPNGDDEWLKHVMIVKDGENMNLSTEPVTLSHFEPEVRKE
ncbi:FAD-binding protein, partial [Chloroflexota bacterium]